MNFYYVSIVLTVVCCLFFALFIVYQNRDRKKDKNLKEASKMFKDDLQASYRFFSKEIAECALVLVDKMEGLKTESKGRIMELLRPLEQGQNLCNDSRNEQYRPSSSLLADVKNRTTELLDEDSEATEENKTPLVIGLVVQGSKLLGGIEELLSAPISFSTQLFMTQSMSAGSCKDIRELLRENKSEVTPSEETGEYHSPEEANLELDENVEEVDTSETKAESGEAEEEKNEEKVDSSIASKKADTGGGGGGGRGKG
ncbi:hypothetical protein KAJ89_04090 [Candidatus Parcubacteria bacterium]|nr:hypothetical protein [Candidatus Parcubacteria bacterium]